MTVNAIIMMIIVFACVFGTFIVAAIHLNRVSKKQVAEDAKHEGVNSND